MCGFCGFANYNDKSSSSLKINDMTSSLVHRGPDDKNIFLEDSLALGHVRLSIIDPSFGAQPMTKKYNGVNYTIVYNGELYNTNEIRNELISKGYSFSSKCDTEVILTSYIEYGKDCVLHFNGIFSFAIYEDKNGSIFLARDHLGIKPLFYCKAGDGSIIFASEIKAILKSKVVKPILDRQGLLELFGVRSCSHTRSYLF